MQVYILPRLTAIIKKVKHKLYEETILNDISIGGSPPIKGTLSPIYLYLCLCLCLCICLLLLRKNLVCLNLLLK